MVAFLDAYRDETRATDPRGVLSDPPPMPLTAYPCAMPAGFPSPAAGYAELLDLNQHLIIQGHAEAIFILRVTRHPMMGLHF